MRAIKMTAKRAGTCTSCRQPIHIGQSIYWARGHGAHHANCETARLQSSLCTQCGGSGLRWNGGPCGACDSTGSADVQRKAIEEYQRLQQPDRTDLDYENQCRDACGL